MQLGKINRKTQKIYLTILLFAIIIAILLCSYFATATTWAANDIDTDDADETYENMKLRVETLFERYIAPTITGIAIIVFIVAGVKNFMRFKSAEDEGEREKTKKAILWWLIGCVGVIVVFWAVPLIIKIAQSVFPSSL